MKVFDLSTSVSLVSCFSDLFTVFNVPRRRWKKLRNFYEEINDERQVFVRGNEAGLDKSEVSTAKFPSFKKWI